MENFKDKETELNYHINNNKYLMIENSKITIELNKLKEYVEKINIEMKKSKKEIKEEIFKKNKKISENIKSLTEFYFYYKYKKNENKKNNEIVEKHKNCKDCVKIIKPKKFFSYNITSQLILYLEKYSLSDCIYFDEKNVCKEMGVYILKSIKYLSHEFPSKSVIWYRNYLAKKYVGYQTRKINSKTTTNNIINERFYNTYLADHILEKPYNKENF